VTLTVRAHLKRYYDCWLICDDAACGRRTRQQSLLATVCLARGCHGHVQMEYGEKALHTQLKVSQVSQCRVRMGLRCCVLYFVWMDRWVMMMMMMGFAAPRVYI
jgi:hypothetical protein